MVQNGPSSKSRTIYRVTFILPSKPKASQNASSAKLLHLAGSDVETNWAWVVVLEVFQAGATDGAELVGDGLTSWACESTDDGRRSWSDDLAAEILSYAALRGVRGGLTGNSA